MGVPVLGRGASGGHAGYQLDVRTLETEGSCYKLFNRQWTVQVYLLFNGEVHHVSCPINMWLVDEAGVSHAVNGHGSGIRAEAASGGPGKALALQDGNGRFSIVVRDSAKLQGYKVTLRVSTGNPASIVATGDSEPIRMCNYALSIHEQPEARFYKDEGGKNSCVALGVRIVTGSGGCARLGQKVPLKLHLQYESGLRVQSQEILTYGAESSLLTDNDGKVTIPFRIEEVSKNHRGQRFVLHVEVDTKRCPMLGNIAPTTTVPMQVLSKRKEKRGRALQVRNGNRQQAPCATTKQASPEGLPTGTLRNMEWMVAGFARDPETGAPDPLRPLHICPCCHVVREQVYTFANTLLNPASPYAINRHGTGCALAAALAEQQTLEEAEPDTSGDDEASNSSEGKSLPLSKRRRVAPPPPAPQPPPMPAGLMPPNPHMRTRSRTKQAGPVGGEDQLGPVEDLQRCGSLGFGEFLLDRQMSQDWARMSEDLEGCQNDVMVKEELMRAFSYSGMQSPRQTTAV